MNKLQILFKSKKGDETKIAIPLNAIHIGLEFLPKEVRNNLDKIGIDISHCGELAKDKTLARGMFIRIENSDLKLTISGE